MNQQFVGEYLRVLPEISSNNVVGEYLRVLPKSLSLDLGCGCFEKGCGMRVL